MRLRKIFFYNFGWNLIAEKVVQQRNQRGDDRHDEFKMCQNFIDSFTEKKKSHTSLFIKQISFLNYFTIKMNKHTWKKNRVVAFFLTLATHTQILLSLSLVHTRFLFHCRPPIDTIFSLPYKLFILKYVVFAFCCCCCLNSVSLSKNLIFFSSLMCHQQQRQQQATTVKKEKRKEEKSRKTRSSRWFLSQQPKAIKKMLIKWHLAHIRLLSQPVD